MNEVLPMVRVLGSRIHMLQLQDVVSRIEKWIQQDKQICRHIVVTGAHGIWEAYKNPDLKRLLNSVDLWIPDGIAPVWLARWHGLPDARRTPGADVMEAFFGVANENGYRSFFYGDTDATLSKLREKLERKYPRHKVVGMLSPPFRPLTPEEDEEVINTINEAKADVLWVGLGMPKQDWWIFEHKQHLNVPVAIGVGAAFGFLSGLVKRAPNWIGNCGLECLWRIIHQPGRLWRRGFLDTPRFVGHVLLELTRLRNYD